MAVLWVLGCVQWGREGAQFLSKTVRHPSVTLTRTPFRPFVWRKNVLCPAPPFCTKRQGSAAQPNPWGHKCRSDSAFYACRLPQAQQRRRRRPRQGQNPFRLPPPPPLLRRPGGDHPPPLVLRLAQRQAAAAVAAAQRGGRGGQGPPPAQRRERAHPALQVTANPTKHFLFSARRFGRLIFARNLVRRICTPAS
eukprot:COSAG04_NODE_361_length_15860_cov_18.114904_2_plen_194_part_00